MKIPLHAKTEILLGATRARFRKREISVRERVLLLLLVAAALVVWASGLVSAFRSTAETNAAAQRASEQNALVLSTREIIRTRLTEKARELRGNADVSGTDLLSVIGELGADLDLKPESSRPVSKNQMPFNVVTVRITLRNAPLEKLIEFDERISNEFPSVAVTEARFQPSGADGLTLTASYEITSFQLQPDAQKKLSQKKNPS